MSTSKKIFSYIKQMGFKTPTDDQQRVNFQFMPGGADYPWSLYVPKIHVPDFLTKYYELKVEPGHRSHLMEKPMKDQNILKIDIDLRYSSPPNENNESTLKHRYTMDMIKDFIRKYIEIASIYVNIPEDAKVTIMEKKHPRFVNEKKQHVKDGVHIMCPEIVAPNAVLMAIYNDFIQNEDAIELFEKFHNAEGIDKAVDSRVIFTNSWYLLGSGKPTDNDYYKPTKTYSISIVNKQDRVDVKLKKFKLEMTQLELITYFSNYNREECCELKEDINIEQLNDNLNVGNNQRTTKLSEFEKEQYKQLIPQSHQNKKMVEQDYIGALLSCLNSNRVEVYDQWFNVACCLYNISPENYPLFVAWSKKCPEKFNADACFTEWWQKIPKYIEKYNTMNLDMLKHYAKQDNIEQYNKVYSDKRTQFFDDMMNNMIVSGFDKATKDILFVQYVKRYIQFYCPMLLKCAEINKNVWYIYRHHRWVKDEDANQVYKLFTHEFLRIFRSKYDEFKELESQARAQQQNQQFNAMAQNNLLSPDMEQMINPHGQQRRRMNANSQDNVVENPEFVIEMMKKKQNAVTELCDFINKSNTRNNIIKALCHECYDEEFYKNLDTNVDVFICENNVLDLKNCIVRPGQGSDMNSIYTNIPFPGDVTSDEAIECFDELEEFFDKLFPDLEVRDYVLDYYAEALSGEHRREEFAIHTGSGRNGKSVFGNLLKITFGDYYYEPDATIYSNYNADPNSPAPMIANIKGKRITNTQEIKNTKPLDTAVIKKMCGGDTLNARHLNQAPIQFTPQCKFNMSCNDIPDLDSNDDAIFRRIIVIPYISTFVDAKDKRLKDTNKFKHHYPCDTTINQEKLKKWSPYFLYLLWQRYIDLHRTNFESLKDTNRPDAVREATAEYQRQSNLYSDFVQEYIKFDPTKKVLYKDILSEFKSYALTHDGKYKNSRQNEKNLKRELSKVGGEAKKGKGGSKSEEFWYISLNGEGQLL
jgi:P4 family phage/plasmid primase-like protien